MNEINDFRKWHENRLSELAYPETTANELRMAREKWFRGVTDRRPLMITAYTPPRVSDNIQDGVLRSTRAREIAELGSIVIYRRTFEPSPVRRCRIDWCPHL